MINLYNFIGMFVFFAIGTAVLYIIANIIGSERNAELANCMLITVAIAALGYFLTLFGDKSAYASIPVMLITSFILIKYIFQITWSRSFAIWIAAVIGNALVLALIYFAAVISGVPFGLVVI